VGRQTKILLGVAVFWPCLYAGFAATSMLYVHLLQDVRAFSGIDLVWVWVDSFLHAFTIAWYLVLFGVCVVLLHKNRRIDRSKRVRWLVAFLLAGPVAFPIYWYFHVWHLPDEDTGNRFTD